MLTPSNLETIATPNYSVVLRTEEEPFYFEEASPGGTTTWDWAQYATGFLADGGRLSLICDMGSLTRGSNSSSGQAEMAVRRRFCPGGEPDQSCRIVCVMALPRKLFANTAIPVALVLMRKGVDSDQIMLIDASELIVPGRRQNRLAYQAAEKVHKTFLSGRSEPSLSILVSGQRVADEDYNLTPKRYIDVKPLDEQLPDPATLIRQLQLLHEEIQASIAKLQKELDDLEYDISPSSERSPDDS